MSSTRTRLAAALLVALAVPAVAPAADPPAAPRTVSELIAGSDRRLVADLLAYVRAHPRAEDRDQAYMALFEKVIEHDWFKENEAEALAYLKADPEGPVRSLAQIVATMARAHSNDYPQALARYNDLMKGLGRPEQEEFAANFADSLASEATAGGHYDISRKVYTTLLDHYGESPAVRQKVKNDLDRLDRVGQPAPEVAARDVKGEPLRFDAYKGKYVLVDFWATWCAPWVADLPRLKATYEKDHPKGFEVVGINLDETKDAALDFVKARGVPWRQVHNATAGGDVVAAFGVNSIPATFLIGPDGRITRLEVRGKGLDQALETLLKAR